MKRFLAMSALVAVLGATAVPVRAQQVFPLDPQPTADTAAVDESPVLWFVELKGKPKADGGSDAALNAERQAFRSDAVEAGVVFNERFVYGDLFNGLSISVRTSDVGKLKQLGSVKDIYPVIDVERPEPTPGDNPDLATAIAQTSADIAQNNLGLTGAGVRVAVMDTGIDYDHPDLGGCFGPGCRVDVGLRLRRRRLQRRRTIPTTTRPDAGRQSGRLQRSRHARGGHRRRERRRSRRRGVPGVTFDAYRVFGCDGSTTRRHHARRHGAGARATAPTWST